MIAKKMRPFLENNSAIRMMFEEGKKMAELYGVDKVYDFSLGNPNVPAPQRVGEAIKEILDEEEPLFVHGYMSNAGYPQVREAIAENLNHRFGTSFAGRNLIMTVGAGCGLNVALKTVLDPGDEVLTFAPYFLEYRAYVTNYDGMLVAVEPDTETFQVNLEAFRAKINEKTKAVIINNPNNPTGVVYSEETIRALAAILNEKQAAYGHEIYLISDEPYRELVFDGAAVPFVTKYYDNTMVVYSYSKSLSLPGERIGYLLIPDELSESAVTIDAATIANRISGCVNAPSLIQLAVGRCVDCQADLDFYDRNRKTLYEGLTGMGFDCIRPQGAFYLWLKVPAANRAKSKSPSDGCGMETAAAGTEITEAGTNENTATKAASIKSAEQKDILAAAEADFVQAAKRYHILAVPGSSFACPGYVRLAYCVSYETIVNALPEFQKLAGEYGLSAK
ncbi:MAG: pyridoxal phosphate-dependent aminotransferase [Lachnospiraceae bacterium]|nr:pyridoxal phosphate-dependent aminotransferase [Lachnospiraceae bacterium]